MPITLKPYPSIGEEEKAAVMEVLNSGILSGYIAGPPEDRANDPNGGPWVRKLEEAWKEKYGVRHAIAFNSATTGLLAAVKAVSTETGRVFIPAWTMSATAAVAKFLGREVVFVDISPYTFDLPDAGYGPVWNQIRPDDTIMAVNLFGQPCDVEGFMSLGCAVIEDSSQTPWARNDHGRRSGTIGHIGVYSLNRHKHIHCGEGGIAVTNDAYFAAEMRAMRNHGITPVGLNLRMTEMQAAVAHVQLQHIEEHVGRRRAIGQALSEAFKDRMGVPALHRMTDWEHDYYLWTAKWDGPFNAPHIKGYIQPLHQVFNTGQRLVVAESLRHEVICFEVCKYDLTPEQAVELVDEAIR